jgi:hypothetical protein
MISRFHKVAAIFVLALSSSASYAVLSSTTCCRVECRDITGTTSGAAFNACMQACSRDQWCTR